MKRIVLLLAVVCIAVSAKAQVYVGGTVGFWSQENGSIETTTVKFLPEAGYAFNDKWAVGAVLGYTITEVDDFETNTLKFAPYARFSFLRKDFIRLFVDGGMAYNSTKPEKQDRVNTFSIGLKPGVALDLSKNISLVAKFGFFGYEEYGDDSEGFGFDVNGNSLSFGLYYSF